MKDAFRIGLAGLGTVGTALLQTITQQQDALTARCGRPIVVKAVSARDKTRDRGIDLSSCKWFDDPVALAQSFDLDCIVELIGGDEGAAKNTVEASLDSKKHVVTANKALLAKHGLSLGRLAEQNRVSLAFEAAVAGGVPVIKTLRESLAGNQVSRVSGILNGTCNYILTRMEREGLSFAECLKDAQKLGYAEADPTFDVEGFDTAHKLALLTSLAFGTQVDADGIYVEGISRLSPLDLQMADELGYRIKLLGVAQKTASGIEQRVHPTMVSKYASLANVMGVTNAVSIHTDMLGELTLIGPGAGGKATASAVLGDILDLAIGRNGTCFGWAANQLTPSQRAPMQRHEGGYYIRLNAYDRPGSAAGIAVHMATANISIESIVQKRSELSVSQDRTGRSGAPVPVVLITYATTESAIREALELINKDGLVSEAPQVIRIERD